MESYKTDVTGNFSFLYQPMEHEAEKASNSYLMSLFAVMVGLPIPIINLIATFIFWINNKKGTYFVRWHCMHALLSQFSLLFVNSISFYWTLSVIFDALPLSNSWIAWIMTAIIFNLAEVVITIQAAIKTRKGKHVYWTFFGPLTDILVKP
jgi:uncharacterized Tic20 family protein